MKDVTRPKVSAVLALLNRRLLRAWLLQLPASVRLGGVGCAGDADDALVVRYLCNTPSPFRHRLEDVLYGYPEDGMLFWTDQITQEAFRTKLPAALVRIEGALFLLPSDCQPYTAGQALAVLDGRHYPEPATDHTWRLTDAEAAVAGIARPVLV